MVPRVNIVAAEIAAPRLCLRVKISGEKGDIFRWWADAKDMKPGTDAVPSEVGISNPNLTCERHDWFNEYMNTL